MEEQEKRDLEVNISDLNKIRIAESPMDEEGKREDKAAYINGKRTSNLMFGYNKNGIKLSDGDYVSLEEVKNAIEEELSKLQENEVVIYKKTNKKVDNAEVIAIIVNEVMKDSELRIQEGSDKIAAKNYSVHVRGKGQETVKKRGNFIVSKDIDLTMGSYVTEESVRKALENFEIFKPKDKEEDELKERITDMLDKYYGNPQKAKEYKARIKRFKSHIIEHNGYKIVEDYPEKKEDEKFLNLREYGYKLKCLSKSEIGDNSEYEYLVDLYNEIGAFATLPPKEDETEYTREELINYLKEIDRIYIETHNGAYNQHLNTQENLKTLGKYGEKQKYLKLSKIKDEKGKVQLKVIPANIGKSLMNTYLFGRNTIKANVYLGIGKYVVAPIHKLIFNGDKLTSGNYKNLRTHRYEARKDYFEQKILEEYKDKEKVNKLSFTLKYVFGSRLNAIFKYKEGNIAVLSAGAHDIKDDINNREVLRTQKYHFDKEIKEEINELYIELNELEEQYNNIDKEDKRNRKYVYYDTRQLMEMKEDIIEQIKEIHSYDAEQFDEEKDTAKLIYLQNELNEIEKELDIRGNKNKEYEDSLKISLQARIDQVKLKILELEEKLNSSLPGIISTDAISLDQHDKANKENITKVVTGVKFGARAVAAKYIGERLFDYIKEKIIKKEYIPGYEKIIEIVEPGKIDKETLEKLSFEDILKMSKNGKVDYYSGGGRNVDRPVEEWVRGIAYNNNGIVVSSSDGIGFDIAGRTNSVVNINNDSKVFDTLAKTISNATGKTVTSNELIESVVNSPNPSMKLEELIKNLDIWVSSKKSGIPRGWLDVTDSGKDLVGEMLKDKVKKVVKEVPGYFNVDISVGVKKVLNKRMATLLGLLGVDMMDDMYEIGRRTKSKEEMKKEGTNKKEVKPYQKATKNSYVNRNTDNDWNFTGTKTGDYASVYDENDLEEEGTKRGR